jgi:hypothetical protein
MIKAVVIAASVMAVSAPSSVFAKGGSSHQGAQSSAANNTSSGHSSGALSAVGKRQYKPIKVVTPGASANKARTADKAYKSIQEYIRQ